MAMTDSDVSLKDQRTLKGNLILEPSGTLMMEPFLYRVNDVS